VVAAEDEIRLGDLATGVGRRPSDGAPQLVTIDHGALSAAPRSLPRRLVLECGWCDSAGHETTAPDLPCENLAAGLSEWTDVAVASLRGAVDDVVVVGHSLGALVAPLVAHRLPIRRMTMLAGIVGAPHASLESLAAEHADRDLALMDDDLETDAEGRFRFSAAGARRVLYHDCASETADAAIARLRFQRSMWTEVADFDAWPDVETVSITCAEDRVVNPTWSNRVARERLGVEAVELPGGHSPFLARPDDADVLTAGLY
jgi:pimeloyl-ACP methyl ester carboxylesterase